MTYNSSPVSLPVPDHEGFAEHVAGGFNLLRPLAFVPRIVLHVAVHVLAEIKLVTIGAVKNQSNTGPAETRDAESVPSGAKSGRTGFIGNSNYIRDRTRVRRTGSRALATRNGNGIGGGGGGIGEREWRGQRRGFFEDDDEGGDGESEEDKITSRSTDPGSGSGGEEELPPAPPPIMSSQLLAGEEAERTEDVSHV